MCGCPPHAQVAGGKDVLGAEYVLPSGMTLPLGQMIGSLRRQKMLREICVKGGAARSYWITQVSAWALRRLLRGI